MKNAYDKYYKEENYFGRPYAGLVSFFRDYKPKGTVLDLGCGQGRDSIALAKLGYDVTGVDISSVGVEQLNQVAEAMKFKLRAITGDIYTYKIPSIIDIVLMDSMQHFYKNDKAKESNLVLRVLKELKTDGLLCICLPKGKSRESILKKLYIESGIKYKILFDDYVNYPEADAEYLMYIVKKEI